MLTSDGNIAKKCRLLLITDMQVLTLFGRLLILRPRVVPGRPTHDL